jgi:pyrroline-5-carboxylate reductase
VSWPASLWLVGCGNMGGSMLRRWVAAGLDPATVTVITRTSTPELPVGVTLVHTPPAEGWPDMLMLAMKPQQLDEALATFGGREGAPASILSILAGVEESVLRAKTGAPAVMRAMPNLPVSIGQGVTALFTSSRDAALRDTATMMMQPLGLVEWLDDEALFDAVTALAGSGPGFLYRFIDALAAGGAAMGIPADQAARLALATVAGSGALAARADADPATLADRVASKGGSTREGLNVLDRDDALVRLLTETLAAAQRRNAEMAAAARG